MTNDIATTAAKTIEAAGAAGGIDEVRRLAERGWPASRPLDGDSPDLREAIQAEATRIVEESDHGTVRERGGNADNGHNRDCGCTACS